MRVAARFKRSGREILETKNRSERRAVLIFSREVRIVEAIRCWDGHTEYDSEVWECFAFLCGIEMNFS